MKEKSANFQLKRARKISEGRQRKIPSAPPHSCHAALGSIGTKVSWAKRQNTDGPAWSQRNCGESLGTTYYCHLTFEHCHDPALSPFYNSETPISRPRAYLKTYIKQHLHQHHLRHPFAQLFPLSDERTPRRTTAAPHHRSPTAHDGIPEPERGCRDEGEARRYVARQSTPTPPAPTPAMAHAHSLTLRRA